MSATWETRRFFEGQRRLREQRGRRAASVLDQVEAVCHLWASADLALAPDAYKRQEMYGRLDLARDLLGIIYLGDSNE